MTAAAKTRCWEGLAAEMLAASGIQRSAQDVKRKWTYYKSGAKCGAAAAKRHRSQTGWQIQTYYGHVQC